MKRLTLAAVLALTATASHAGGISGTFQTQPNDSGHIGMVAGAGAEAALWQPFTAWLRRL